MLLPGTVARMARNCGRLPEDVMPDAVKSQPLPSRPPRATLFAVWIMLGFQSFGGGSATLSLIRSELVERRKWLTDAEFVRDWALCQVTPGINLLGLTILIGRRLGGIPGVFLALTGLLLPSCAVTIALTATYAHFRTNPLVTAALRGVIPVTAGIGFAMAVQLARPLLAASRRLGRSNRVAAFVILGTSVAATAVTHIPVIACLLIGGAAGAAVQWRSERRRTEDDN